MHPVVCLDRGFSSRFESEFGWISKGVEYQIDQPGEIANGLTYLQDQAAQGAWVVFALNYESGFHLMELPKAVQEKEQAAVYIRALIFDEPPKALTLDPISPVKLPQWQALDFAGYASAFNAIQDAITAGVCYQVNHTFRVQGQSLESPWDLYRTLLHNQPANYGGFIDFGEHQILSRSPELFLEKRGLQLRSEPMKGTAPRSADALTDTQILQTLLSDTKMQSENLMIVDLIRNDLSRVSEPHSVKVSRLFEPRSLKSVHQVSSVIESTAARNIETAQLIQALFPCGSVVGAPKAKAFELIQQLEANQRGVYTGSLGLIEPDGDLTLSVAIRTIEQTDTTVVLGLGSGLVADSVLDDEWNECILKGKFAGIKTI